MPSTLWINVLQYVQPRLSHDNFQTWFAPLVCLDLSSTKLVVGAPTRFHADWTCNNYRPLLQEALAGLGHPSLELVWQVAEVSTTPLLQPEPASVPTPAIKTMPAPVVVPGAAARAIASKLSPKYNFESFVVGPSNELAHAACAAAAASPGKRYNPIFLYGGVGLGKTHLINAVGQHVLGQDAKKRVFYISTEQFTNEFIAALQHHKIQEFRKRYRHECDVLLVDDIQFLAGRVQTQEEFFHTFNALYHADRQIVVTCDVGPQQIGEVQERLISRFQWGLVADIQPPGLDTRIAILRKKAEAGQLDLDPKVLEFVAAQGGSNVRELEGLLLRLVAKAELFSGPISLELAQSHLARPASGAALDVEEVQKTVCSYFNLRMSDIKSQRRHRSYAVPRMIAMYLCRKALGLSYPELGERFGGKDHTTVLSAVRRIESLMGTDERVRLAIDHLQKKLNAA
jgi:chromosomal replication initiator protein